MNHIIDLHGLSHNQAVSKVENELVGISLLSNVTVLGAKVGAAIGIVGGMAFFFAFDVYILL